MAEKYTRWCDKSTGINPFLVDAIRSPASLSVQDQILFYVRTLLWGVPRFVLASIALSFSLFLSFIFNLSFLGSAIFYLKYSHESNLPILPASFLVLIAVTAFLPLPFPSPVSMAKDILNRITITIAAYLLGVEYDLTAANTSRVVGVRTESSASPKPFSSILPGDLIISNLTNALELFVYDLLCSPLFVFPIYDESSKSTSPLCIGLSFISALSYTLHLGTHLNSLSKVTSLPVEPRPLLTWIQQAKKANRPVLLFIEGIKTNATGVLEFPSQIFNECEIHLSQANINLCSISYPSTQRSQNSVSPACPIDSHFNRFLWLSSQFSRPQTCQMTFLSFHHLPKYDKKKYQSIGVWLSEIRVVFGKLINKKLLTLTLGDYHSFAQYYNALREGKIEIAKSIADNRGK